MKKFLRIFSPSENVEIPSALDQRILAAAALRANKNRKRRQQIRIFVPAAAAAAFAVCAGVLYCSSLMTESTQSKIEKSVQRNDMLALSDMTSLEQYNYNTSLALAEAEFQEDVFFM